MVLKMKHLVEKTTATGERFIGGIMPPRGQVKIYKHKEIHVHMRVRTHTHLAGDILLCAHSGLQNRLLVRVGQNLMRTATYTETRLPDRPGC